MPAWILRLLIVGGVAILAMIFLWDASRHLARVNYHRGRKRIREAWLRRELEEEYPMMLVPKEALGHFHVQEFTEEEKTKWIQLVRAGTFIKTVPPIHGNHERSR